MLFIPHTPTQLLITREDKIILTTQQQLYFTTLHFIEEFLSTQLSYPYPKCIEYSQQKSQALVVTKNSIELYWTDWEHKVQLFLVLNLNNERIFSIQSKNGWEIFGEFKQYSPKKIKLWKIQSIDEEYPSCFFGSKQFLVNSKNLAVYDHQKKDHKTISWNEASEYAPSIQRSKAQMKIFQLKQGTLLLQAGSILLYFTEHSVQYTLCHEGELFITKNVATWVYQGMMTIYTFEEAAINNHGAMEIFDGHFYGSSLEEDKLLMLFYEFREIRVRTIHLVSEQENNSFEKLKRQKNLLKNQMKANSKQLGFSKIPKRRTTNFQKDPIVEVVDISQTKSYSGVKLREALKESIGKFKEEFDKSHEEQKFDDAMLPNNEVGLSESREVSERNREYYQMGEVREPRQASVQQNFEQQNDIMVRSNIPQSIANSNISYSSIPQVQTPAFQIAEHHLGDQWNAFNSAWQKNQVKKQKIEAIDQQFQNQHNAHASTSKHFSVNSSNSENNDIQIQFVESEDESDHGESIVKDKEHFSLSQSEDLSKKPFQQKLFNFNQSQPFSSGKNQSHQLNLNDGASMKNSVLSSRKKILSSNIFFEQFQIPIVEEPTLENRQTPVIGNNSYPDFPGPILTSNDLNNDQKNDDVLLESQPFSKVGFHDFQDRSNDFQNKENGFNLSRVLKPVLFEENVKYTQLLSEIERKHPEDFQQSLEKHMSQLIKQKEARLFFAEHIRNFNAELTMDKLLRLYKNVEDTEQNREYMTKALSQFKLSEVPSSCLCFDDSVLSIFRMIYPDVYIEDILEPNFVLIDTFLKKYFEKGFNKKYVNVENIKISLQKPRNILNILLYLNQFFNLDIKEIFLFYCKTMIKRDYIEVIQKLMNSDVPKICDVQISVFEEAAQRGLYQLLEQKITDFGRLENILPLMSSKKRKIYNQIINLIEDFSISSIIYDLKAILELPNTKDSFSIVKDIINLNSSHALAKIDLSSVLSMISIIANGRTQNYYSSKSVELTKMLATKLINFGFMREGFTTLIPIATVLSRSFLVGLLLKYVKGNFVNRLTNMTIESNMEFTNIFKQILTSRKIPKCGDSKPLIVENKSSFLQWQDFNKQAESIIEDSSWELRYLIYVDIQLAYYLIGEGVVSEAQLRQCCKILGYPFKNHQVIKKMDEQLQNLKIKFGESSGRSNQSESVRFIRRSNGIRHTKTIRSLKGSDTAKQITKSEYFSKSFYEDNPDTKSHLFNIKFEVVPKESIKILREYYENSTLEQFFEALRLTDHERIDVRDKTIEKYKSVVNQRLNFNIRQLIPFEYFFNEQQSWQITKKYILKKLNIDNFWIIFLVVEIFYAKSVEVSQMLIEYFVQELSNDKWSQIVGVLLKKVPVSKEKMAKMSEKAEAKRLVSIHKNLLKYIE